MGLKKGGGGGADTFIWSVCFVYLLNQGYTDWKKHGTRNVNSTPDIGLGTPCCLSGVANSRTRVDKHW